MKRWLQSRWFWLTLLLLLMLPLSAVLYLRQSTINPMHAALDQLSGIQFGDRWTHPQMVKIRELGPKAIPPLRQVLREKDNPSIRFLLWVKTKWPNVTKHYSRFPDAQKLSERRHTACQILKTFGPAARDAAPDLIAILKNGDLGDLNSAMMVVYSMGIDADICDQFATLWENQTTLSAHARSVIVGVLSGSKPPSDRALKILVAALSDPSPFVPYQAAQTLGGLGVRSPEIISGLKQLQSNSTNKLAVVTASAALWELEKNPDLVWSPTYQALDSLRDTPIPSWLRNGSGGQGVSAEDQAFVAAGTLFSKMDLSPTNKAKALSLLEFWADKTDRIFIRMHLLPSMMALGYPKDECIKICQTGLNQSEVYYQIQAAGLFVGVCEKFSYNDRYLDVLLRHDNVGVRAYAAKIHWHTLHNASAVLPVLIDALDREKYQSYYYPETQTVALQTLAELGPEAQSAIEALEKTTRDPNPASAKLATNALAKIRK